MPSDSLFHWARLRTNGRNFTALAEQLVSTTLPALSSLGGKPWAVANGLFGFWTNELLLVTTWPRAADASTLLTPNLPEGAEIVEQHNFVATARPVDDTPLSSPGLYVHRFFEVRNADVDRFVALSEEAWNTFENTSEYAAQPQGLFCQRDRSDESGLMLLVTWYDRFESWERSRTPPPEAETNFRARAMLTRRSMAFATRLVGTGGAPRGMGPA
jgi:hypothetical protein